MTFRLNDRLNQLSGQDIQAGSPRSNTEAIKTNPPKSGLDDEFFKGRAWNPYKEMQHMQDEMEQVFGESLSRFHMNTPLGSLSKTADVDLQKNQINIL